MGASFLGITPGEWLQAASGFAGVAATISATLWIEARKRRRERKAEIEPIAQALDALDFGVRAIDQLLDPDSELAAWDLLVTWMTMRDNYKVLNFTRAGVRLRGLAILQPLTEIDVAFARAARDIDNDIEHLSTVNNPETHFVSDSRGRLQQLASAVEYRIHDAQRAIRQEHEG